MAPLLQPQILNSGLILGPGAWLTTRAGQQVPYASPTLIRHKSDRCFGLKPQC